MSWNTQSGQLQNSQLADSEYWQLFNFFFSNACKKTSTYKFALLKAILDNLFNNVPEPNGNERILYKDLFAKFSESFWNLVVKYGLHQQKVNINGKTSKIEQIFQKAVKGNPVLQNLEFIAIESQTRANLVRQVQAECKKYVLGAMYDDFLQNLYAFDLNGEFISLSTGAYKFLLKYKMEIEKLNYYHWARFLEAVNEESVLYGVLGKLELSLPKREPLSIFREILQKEFEENNCFYCGRKLSGMVHVDHFIPWSFIKEDRLWNFVLSCPECNLKKSDILPAEALLPRIQKRNRDLLSQTNPFIDSQFENYDDNLLPELWSYARSAGFRTVRNFSIKREK